jgi:hypothetical protein
MTADVATSFITYYIRSLAERTRVEKTSTKYGFDWIIYNLALAEGLTPCRLPFLRRGPDEISKTKTEPEFGIDCSFLSPDRKTLTVFVLKDEILSNANWKTHDFDPDLRAATTVDLGRPEFKDVGELKVVLAYNKDEDRRGVEHFDRLTRSLGTKVGDYVPLSFERWNLTTLTEKVKQTLLTPSLLPQSFFSLFGYICSQFGDFRHGSEEWNRQLVPNWRRFLHDLLKDQADERSVRLLPVALIILRKFDSGNPSAETGYIDLVEWAMLAAWEVSRTTHDPSVQKAIVQMWVQFYLAELERFYHAHAAELAVEHGLDLHYPTYGLGPIVSAVVAFWHLGRLGILAFGYSELLARAKEQERKERAEALNTIANWLVTMLNANPSTKRPLLDIHHIELFLVWRILWQVGRKDDIYHWLQELQKRLLVRRAGKVPLPFIEGGNSMDLVFETVATGKKPPEFQDQSSVLLLCLLELCFSLDQEKRDELIHLLYSQVVLGQDPNGEQMKECVAINLMGWIPSEDWADRVLTKSLGDEGESQPLESLNVVAGEEGASIARQLEAFVHQVRTTRPIEFPPGLPRSTVILACLKHHSPLPPEFWRGSIFGPIKGGADKKSTTGAEASSCP